jgi:hypothetical protein
VFIASSRRSDTIALPRYRFFDQRGHEELFPILNPLSSSNLVERSHYQIASPKKIPMENRSRAAPNAHVA